LNDVINPVTDKLLPYVRIVTYDLKKNVDRCFNNPDDAMRFVKQSGTTRYNLYRIEKINGTWRTDWVKRGAA
jgi:hypothetical protein